MYEVPYLQHPITLRSIYSPTLTTCPHVGAGVFDILLYIYSRTSLHTRWKLVVLKLVPPRLDDHVGEAQGMVPQASVVQEGEAR